MTADTVETVTISVPISGQIPLGWCAWDMPCGCREAAGPNSEMLTVRCDAACTCFQCVRRG